MEESELVVQQLTNKLRKVQEEMILVQNEISIADDVGAATSDLLEERTNVKKKKYSEILELQERKEELQSQLRIVERYLQRARLRYSKLQNRYKERLSYTTNDTAAAAATSATRTSTTAGTSSNRPSSSSTTTTATAVTTNNQNKFLLQTFK